MSYITELRLNITTARVCSLPLTFLHAAHVAQLCCLVRAIFAIFAGTGAHLQTILLTNRTGAYLVQTSGLQT